MNITEKNGDLWNGLDVGMSRDRIEELLGQDVEAGRSPHTQLGGELEVAVVVRHLGGGMNLSSDTPVKKPDY